MPKYTVDGKQYAIPDNRIEDFEKKYPNATIEYYNDGDIYDIPLNKREVFLAKLPNATTQQPIAKEEQPKGLLSRLFGNDEEKAERSDFKQPLKASQEVNQDNTPNIRPITSDSIQSRLTEQPDVAEDEVAEFYNRRQELQKTANRQQVADLSAYIESQLERRGKELDAIAAQNPMMMQAHGTAMSIPVFDAGRTTDPEIRDYQAAKRAMENARNIINEADINAKNGKGSSFAAGAARGFGQKFFDLNTYDMGLSDLSDNAAMLKALETADENPHALTPSQQALLDAKAVELATNAYFGSSVGRGYKAGQVTAEAIPFMLEMAINPAKAVGQSLTNKLTRYALKRFGNKEIQKQGAKYVITKAGAKVLGDVAAASGMTATTGAARTAADAVQRMAGGVSPNMQREDGRVEFWKRTQGEESPIKAIAKAFAGTTIEYYSEMMGEYFSPVLSKARGLSAKALDKLGLGKVNRFIDDVSSSDFAQLVKDFEGHAKWNGTIGEFAEEIAGGVLNAAIVGDQTLDNKEGTGVFNKENLIDTFLGVSLLGGAFSGVKTAYYPIYKYEAYNAVNSAKDDLMEAFKDSENVEELERSLSTPQDAANALAKIAISPNFDPNKFEAAARYAQAIQRYNGALLGEQKRRTGIIVEAPEQLEVEQSYDNGRTLESPQEMNDANNQLGYAAAEVRRVFGLGEDADVDNFLGADPVTRAKEERENDEEIGQAILDYLNAKATYDGMIDGVRANIEAQQRHSDNIINQRANKEDGMIHPALRKVDDKPVYIVNGNIALNDDGTIDNEKSSESVVYLDAETGKLDFAKPSDFHQVSQPIDAEEEKTIARNQIAEELAQKASDKIDGVLPFQPNDVYPVLGADGTEHNLQVIADQGDSSVAVKVDGVDGVIPKDEIQQMANAYNLARRDAYNEERKAERMAEQEVIQPQAEQNTEQQQEQTPKRVIPTLKDGKTPDFNAMNSEMFVDEYVSRYGEDSAIKIARKNIANAKDNIAKIDKKIDDITDPNQMESLYVQRKDVEEQLNRYNDILSRLGASEDANETEADQQSRLKKEAGNRIASLFRNGMPNVESFILADIATGNRLRWSDKTANGAVTSKGLGAELGLSEAERRKRLPLIGKEAMTPEEYAESLKERLESVGIRYDESSLRDAVLDVYSSVDSRNGAWEALESIANKANEQEVDTDWESMQQERAYKQAQSVEENIPELPNLETIEEETPISEGEYAEMEAKAQTEEQKDYDAMMAENPPVEESVEQQIEVAEQDTNPQPTEAQKKAGNYKKGHIKIDGFDITIETPKGVERKGVDEKGNPWSVIMNNTYGYIRGTEGVDGDHIDMFLSDNLDNWNGNVYVIDQIKPDGSFDEHKVMYGFDAIEDAQAAYLSNYSEGWKGLGSISGTTKEEFKKWIASSHRKTKPFTEYKSVKTAEGQSVGQTTEDKVVEQGEKPKTPNSKADTKVKKLLIEPTKPDYTTVVAPSMVTMEVPMNVYKYVSKDKLNMYSGVYFDKDKYLVATDLFNLVALKVRDMQRSDAEKFVTKQLDKKAEGTFNWRDILVPADKSIDGVIDFVDIVGKVGKKAKKNEKPKAVRIAYNGESILIPAERLQPLADFQKAVGIGDIRFANIGKDNNIPKIQISTGANVALAVGLDPKVAPYWSVYEYEVGGELTPPTSEKQESAPVEDVTPKSEVPDVIRGDKWNATGEPTKMKFNRKGDNFDGYITVGIQSDAAVSNSEAQGAEAVEETEVQESTAHSSILSEEEYIDKILAKRKPKNMSIDEWEFSDEYVIAYNEGADEYPDYIKGLADSGELQKAFDKGTLGDQIAIRKNIQAAGYDVSDLISTNNKKKPKAKKSRGQELMDNLGLTKTETENLSEPNNYRFRTADDITKNGDEYTIEEQQIIDNAKVNGTYLKAPNGKDTNLTPKQWVQVRTEAFKEWFGDWENKSLANYLLGNDVVATLSGNEFVKDGTPLSEKVTQYYIEHYNGKVERVGLGEVLLDKRSVKDSASHGLGKAKSAAFAAVPNIITDGRIIDSQTNWKDRGYDSVTIAAPIRIGEENYVGVVVVKKSKEFNRFYLHEVMIQKSLRDGVFQTNLNVGNPSGDIAKVIKNIINANNSSKIIDANGEPKVVYHRTPNKFTSFDVAKIGSSTDWGAFGKGFYFSPDAEQYRMYGDKTMALFLNARNPLMLDDKNAFDVKEPFFKDYSWGENSSEAFTKWVKDNGYDAVIYNDGYKEEDIVFNPNQIKSATDNVGTFDVNNDDVRFRSAESAPVFYSNAEYAVNNIKQEKATLEQWLKMIEKNGGLKAGEDKWLGLSDWLKSSDKKTLTKQEVLDFIKENQIQIEEVVYGSLEETPRFKELRNEYKSLLVENDYNNERTFEAMVDKYGEDFELAFEGWGNDLHINDYYGTEAADAFLDARDINDTRIQYTTDGLDNKREIALTVPTIESWNESDEIHFGDAGNGRAIAWVRFGETTDSEGKRVLVIDEVQSKRHQEGREKGYVDANIKKRFAEVQKQRTDFRKQHPEITTKVNDALYGRISKEEYKEWATSPKVFDLLMQEEALNREYNNLRDALEGVPYAPFEKNWAELAMKRMLRYAAENGFDKIAWTTGEQQAERYDLSKSIERIVAEDNTIEEASDGTPMAKEITLTTAGGMDIRLSVDANGIVRGREYDGKKLSDVVGKPLADKLMQEGYMDISGEGLKVGGEGMKAFYDQMIPSFMNKYGKKWGVKVQDVTLPHLAKSSSVMHSIDVTDAMRESVMQGQPMFRPAESSNVDDAVEAKAEKVFNNTKAIATAYGIDNSIVVATSEADFKAKMLEAGVEEDYIDQNAIAVYIPETGEIVINSQKVASDKDLVESIVHEKAHNLTHNIDKWRNIYDAIIPVGEGRFVEFANNVLKENLSPIKSADEIIATFVGKSAILQTEDGRYLVRAMLNNRITSKDIISYLQSSFPNIYAQYGDVLTAMHPFIQDSLETIKKQYNERRNNVSVSRFGTNTRASNRGNAYRELATPTSDRGSSTIEGVSEVRREPSERRGRTVEERTQSRILAATSLAESLGVKLNVIEDVNDITDANSTMQRDKRGAKGWYNVATDQVYFVAPNATSIQDAEESVLHEVVAHKGLRDVVGRERFDAFLGKVYRGASPEIRKAITKLAAKKGWDFNVATEEYLASLAERGFEDKENRTFWQKVRDLFMDMLREAKIMLGYNINDNDLRYMLWRTYQMQKSKGVMAAAEDVVMQQKLGVGNFRTRFIGEKEKTLNYLHHSAPIAEALSNSELSSITKIVENFENPTIEGAKNEPSSKVLFRSAGDQAAEDKRKAIRAEYDKIVNTGRKGTLKATKYNFIEATQDEMLSLKEYQELLKKHYGLEKLPSYLDAYMRENRISSAGYEEFLRFEDGVYEDMNSIIDEYIKQGETFEDIKEYAIAKSGLERNREFTVRDYIDDKANEKLISKTEAEAQLAQVAEDLKNDVITPTEADAKRQQIQNLRSQNKLNAEDVKALKEDYAKKRDAYRKQLSDGHISYSEFNKLSDALAKKFTGRSIEDYSGLSAMAEKKGEKADKWQTVAQDVVAAFESKHKDTAKLWNAIKACNDAVLKKMSDSGLLNDDVYSHLRQQFVWYIPMSGFTEDTAEDVYSYIGNETGAFTPAVKKAAGRLSESDDPFAIIGNKMQGAILQGNRNLLKQTLLNLSRTYPTDLITEDKVWLVKQQDGTWETNMVDIPEGATSEEAAKLIKEHSEKMRKLKKQGLAMEQTNKLSVPYKVTVRSHKNDHEIVAYRNGVPVVMYVNGNPQLAKAINGKLKDRNINIFYELLDKWNRIMSANKSSWNPDFIVPNVLRDFEDAIMSTFIDAGVKDAAKLAKTVVLVFPEVVRSVSGSKNKSGKYANYFEEFLQNGGETGYSHLRDVEKWKEINQRRWKRLNLGEKALKTPKGAFDGIGSMFSYLNRIAEDSTRFGTYVYNREKGKSIGESIKAAKDITTNFNKKGSGATEGIWGFLANFMRRWLLFFNPMVQGLYKHWERMNKNSMRYALVFAAMAGGGYLAAVLNKAASDDDDEEKKYFNQSDYTRRTNIMVYTGDGYVKIPLAPVFREMYALGDIVYSVQSGIITPWEGTKEVVNLVRSLFNLEGQSSLKDQDFSWFRFVIPQSTEFMADIEDNVTFTGTPLYKDTPWNKFDPEYQKVYKGTWTPLVKLSKAVNDILPHEGYMHEVDDKMAGKGSSKWINPAVWQHIIEEVAGGVGKTIGDVITVGDNILNKKETDIYNIPIAKRFYSEPDERMRGRILKNQYYNATGELEKMNNKYKKYTDYLLDNLNDPLDIAAKIKEYWDSDAGKLHNRIKNSKSKVDNLDKQLKAATDDATAEEITLMIENEMKNLIEFLKTKE